MFSTNAHSSHRNEWDSLFSSQNVERLFSSASHWSLISERQSRSCKQEAIDKYSNKENQSFFFSLRPSIQACYSRNSNSYKLLKLWEGLSELDHLTLRPLIQNTTDKIDAALSQLLSHSHVKGSPGTTSSDQRRGGEDTRTPLALGESKPVVKVHFTTFLKDSAESSILSEPWGEPNSHHTGSFPSSPSSRSASRHFFEVYFHSSLSCGNFDVQWFRQVDPAWTLSLTGVQSLNMPKIDLLSVQLLKKWCDQLGRYLWPHCFSWL